MRSISVASTRNRRTMRSRPTIYDRQTMRTHPRSESTPTWARAPDKPFPHHRALHRGELDVEGTGASNVLFRHSDGSPYGNIGNPRRFDLQTKLFTALRNLGFRESEARAAVAQLRADATLANAPIEQWLRAALQRMTR